MQRIDDVRKQLIERGFLCLSGGKFGLPSYTDAEAWACGKLMVYLLFDRKTGGWDILTQIDRTNTIDGAWAAVDELIAKVG